MSVPDVDDAAIREQAYYFWEQDGRPHGRETEYWTRAAVALASKSQMNMLIEPEPTKPAKAAASKAKAAPQKAAKAEPKAKPKKK